MNINQKDLPSPAIRRKQQYSKSRENYISTLMQKKRLGVSSSIIATTQINSLMFFVNKETSIQQKKFIPLPLCNICEGVLLSSQCSKSIKNIDVKTLQSIQLVLSSSKQPQIQDDASINEIHKAFRNKHLLCLLSSKNIAFISQMVFRIKTYKQEYISDILLLYRTASLCQENPDYSTDHIENCLKLFKISLAYMEILHINKLQLMVKLCIYQHTYCKQNIPIHISLLQQIYNIISKTLKLTKHPIASQYSILFKELTAYLKNISYQEMYQQPTIQFLNLIRYLFKTGYHSESINEFLITQHNELIFYLLLHKNLPTYLLESLRCRVTALEGLRLLDEITKFYDYPQILNGNPDEHTELNQSQPPTVLNKIIQQLQILYYQPHLQLIVLIISYNILDIREGDFCPINSMVSEWTVATLQKMQQHCCNLLDYSEVILKAISNGATDDLIKYACGEYFLGMLTEVCPNLIPSLAAIVIQIQEKHKQHHKDGNQNRMHGLVSLHQALLKSKQRHNVLQKLKKGLPEREGQEDYIENVTERVELMIENYGSLN